MEPERQQEVFAELEAWAGSPGDGLPNELFRFLTRLVPTVNVDLLISDKRLDTLQTWRHDELYGPGWHVPGGIIRYRETTEDRIRKTAERELGVEVEFALAPVAIEQFIASSRQERGHMISLLYRCRLLGTPAEGRQIDPQCPAPGQWGWHRECPANLILERDRYRKFI
jgi:colanic acid biosynthesis protein WcaH